MTRNIYKKKVSAARRDFLKTGGALVVTFSLGTGAVGTAVAADQALAKILALDQVDVFFFFQAEDGIRDRNVNGVQTCALPISGHGDDRVQEAARAERSAARRAHRGPS